MSRGTLTIVTYSASSKHSTHYDWLSKQHTYTYCIYLADMYTHVVTAFPWQFCLNIFWLWHCVAECLAFYTGYMTSSDTV